jgi:hypothetical protein
MDSAALSQKVIANLLDENAELKAKLAALECKGAAAPAAPLKAKLDRPNAESALADVCLSQEERMSAIPLAVSQMLCAFLSVGRHDKR